jgi:alpha-L-rhamnosidase
MHPSFTVKITSKKIVPTVLAVLLLLAWAPRVAATLALQPVNLRCDVRVNPLGIGDATPRLSWQLQSAGTGTLYRGETQSAFQIQVGSAAGASDLWDSGVVVSANTDIIYGGAPLTSGKQCYWRVQVCDGNGYWSTWSASAQWSMGLLAATDWSAQWVGYDAAYSPTPQQATNNALFNTSGLNWISYSGQTAQNGVCESALRRQVILPAGQTITNAVVALYADNACTVYVNGRAMTNSAFRWEATARINVTSSLHPGTNELALDATSSDSQETATVIGRLVVQFASGSISNIPVDTTWKAAQWPATGWTQTNYNDSAWATPGSNGSTPWGTPSLNDSARVPASYLRRNFNVSKAVTRATVYVTALGAYELHLNGQKVGNDVLTPGWSEFTKRVFYQTYDVTSMVQPGSNTLAAILGDGWYASNLAFKGQRLNYGGTPRFLAQLALQFSDGSTQTVVSDSSWKASYGPIQWGDLLLGSEYDARLEMPGWDTTNFSDSAWSAVATGLSAAALHYTNVTALLTSLVSNNQLNITANNTTMGGDPALNIVKALQITYSLGGTTQTVSYAENATVSLGGTGQALVILQAYYGEASLFPGNGGFQVQAAVTEPSRCLETVAATSLTVPSPGCYTFDLGQNMVGWVQLNISGSVGDRITVRHGEMLNPDGTVYVANLRGATATDFYIFGTNGPVVFQPWFTFHGFRYVEIRGLTVAPTLSSVTGIVVHSDMPRAGTFACSSPLVSQLYSNIVWGQKGNYFEVPTDCPQRDERMGWTGDTEFFVPTALYNYDAQSFYHRHLVTLCQDSQESDGSFANVAPDLGAGSGAAAWGDAAWICTYNVYRTYGDTNVIVDNYASFQTYGQYLAAHASNYVISSLPGDFGDWLNLGGGATGSVIDTAFYAYYAQAMSEMAAAIGKTADAATYATLRTNIATAYAGFFTTNGSFSDGSSQTGYSLAYTLNLVPASLLAPAAQQFASTIAQFNNHLATGFIGTPRLLPALHAAGRDDLAYQILLQKTYPSWLYQVTLGATTMWERWDGWTPGGGFETVAMNSFNHYSFGAVGQYLYSAVAGINAASPGYKTVLIQPVPGVGLNWAGASYNSVRGPISSSWTNIGNTFSLAVAIPPNTTAQIWVPTTNAGAITESGMPAASSPGVSYLGTSNSYAVFAVGSGNYFWSSPLPTPPTPPTVGETDQVYAGGSFPPLLAGDLLTNQSTIIVSNTLAFGPENHLAATSLSDGLIGAPLTTNRSCEISGGYITYYLGPGTNGNGFTITNVSTYTAWQDDGREDADYAVSYSYDGTNFFSLASVAYNPSPYPTKDGTGGTLTSLAVTNLAGVQYLQWTFSSSQQNSGVGYTEVAAYGAPGRMPQPSLGGTVLGPGAGGVVMIAGGLVPGHTYELQSTTNLLSPDWFTETNFIAAQGSATLTNSISNYPQKFYRVVGN